MIFVFLCCLTGFLLLVTYFIVYSYVWYKAGGDLLGLINSINQAARKLAPGVIRWATLGSVCGLIGVLIMTNIAGVSLIEAGWWLWIGIITGLGWGIIWGIIYGITEPKS